MQPNKYKKAYLGNWQKSQHTPVETKNYEKKKKEVIKNLILPTEKNNKTIDD